MANQHTYLALGDSMSIDDYTGVEGGGAVSQFYRTLGSDWSLDDRTFDGCQMAGVSRDGVGDVITLTIGGNDLLWNKERYLREGIDEFAAEHLALLRAIRDVNPQSIFLVGNIYAPSARLSTAELRALEEVNDTIHTNCFKVDAELVGIHHAFKGREETLLCHQIEPTFEGASVIAKLFAECLAAASG